MMLIWPCPPRQVQQVLSEVQVRRQPKPILLVERHARALHSHVVFFFTIMIDLIVKIRR